MHNKLLTVLTTNYNTSDFIEISLYALKKLTKNDYSVFINDNGSRKKDLAKLLNLSEEHDNVFLHFRNSKGERASLAHGRALDVLTKQVNTKYTVVLDSDAVVLKKNWDQDLINKINDEVKIVGSYWEEARNFPSQFVVLFETEIFKQLDISWQPKLKIEPGFDTSWELKPKYFNAGYKGAVLVQKNTRRYEQGPFNALLGVEEYYLKSGDEIFASHFGRGATLGSAKYRKGTNFIYRIPKIGRLFRMARGKQEKKKWISIAKSIIDKQ